MSAQRENTQNMSLIPFENRNFAFQSIYNFRDFGGYVGRSGKAVKTGRLFRSAHLAALNNKDLSAISDLDINLIVDLRYAPERKRQPSRFPSPMPHLNEYPDASKTKQAKVAPHEAFLEHELYTAEDAHRYMMGSYKARPLDTGFQAICKDTLQYMARSDDAEAVGVLVHCAAGKDRTGTLCALIQGVLGVSHEDILTDYMMTLDAVDIDNIIGPAAKMFSKRYGREINPKAIWPMFGVVPEFLESALAGMTDAAGSFERFVTEVLQISTADLDRLRARYLA